MTLPQTPSQVLVLAGEPERRMFAVAMARLGHSGKTLAAAADCSPSLISSLRTLPGKGVTRSLAERITKALDVPTDLLFVPAADNRRSA